MADHEVVARKVDEIEAEMRRIGDWQSEPPPPEAFRDMGAFGHQTMAFEQWLQWVFLPRVREIVAERGDFPGASQVSQQAYKEWRMWGEKPDSERLLELLQEFDGMFGG
jgi:uncharacterized protein YqcC (DUF446 family)